VNPVLGVDELSLRDRFSFARLLRPIGGLMEEVSILTQEHTAPAFEVGVTALDNMTMTFPHVSTIHGTDARNESLGGAGADADPEKAWIRAVVEGAERYCCMVYQPDDFVVASANELGTAALDLGTVPRCSDREYADPACPLRRPDPTAPIRWVRGYSLIDRCERYVPAVMTYLYINPRRGEGFWQTITTGVAAHTSLVTALISAICEMIERDAIALTWLARLPLPRIEFESPLPRELITNYGRLERSLVRQYFYDATTDLGVPTIYSVQVVDAHPKLAQYVSCATDFSAAAACAKTIREAAPARAVFQLPRAIPGDVADFQSLYEGAVYMGRSEQRSAFDFLLKGTARRPLSAVEIDPPHDERSRLRFLIDRLRAIGTDAIVVDMTTDEVRDAGLWVVRVVVPGLLPMSTIHRARFLGHPRLYTYPEQAGFGTRVEGDINPAPQPFA
jgi:ribosomal protein S12 methylthiotransferase accessory factor